MNYNLPIETTRNDQKVMEFADKNPKIAIENFSNMLKDIKKNMNTIKKNK